MKPQGGHHEEARFGALRPADHHPFLQPLRGRPERLGPLQESQGKKHLRVGLLRLELRARHRRPGHQGLRRQDHHEAQQNRQRPHQNPRHRSPQPQGQGPGQGRHRG